MEKLQYLRALTEQPRLSYSEMEVVYPLILALSPAEAAMFFDLSFEQHYQVRQWAARKISGDMAETVEGFHSKLIAELVSMVNLTGFVKRESCGYTLMYLIGNVHKELQREVIAALLSSRYRCVRERAYKRLQEHWDTYFLKKVADNWEIFNDKMCLKLMLKHFPEDHLIANFDTIRESLSNFQLTGLFLKYQDGFKYHWDMLKSNDWVSYAYLLTKLGSTLTAGEAAQILAENYLNDRIGLLLWCFGKMGLWETLVSYNDTYRQKILDHKLGQFQVSVL